MQDDLGIVTFFIALSQHPVVGIVPKVSTVHCDLYLHMTVPLTKQDILYW